MDSSTEYQSAVERCEDLMSKWRAERNTPSFDPVPLLLAFANLLEEQINIFYSTDPDPFDDRHPLRTDSNCELGQILRLLSTHDSFLERITFDYLSYSTDPNDRVVVVALRLLCAMRLGVTLSFTLDEEDATINTLYRLALSESEPTNCYALLLLGSVLDNTELLYVTRQKNLQLIQVVMQRLSVYAKQLENEIASTTAIRRSASMINLLGSFHLETLTTEMKIRLTLAFLLPVAEYQDLMPYMYNNAILPMVYTFISPEVASGDIRLTFVALRLLGNLMCHRCVYLDFVENGGLQLVLQVPRPSVAATAVSVVLYYTAYFEDAMERVCQLPGPVLTELIRYALWLVECSHPSARCYSLYFLNLVLCYGVTYDLFEAQNGLVYLHNAVCVLPLRLTEDNPPIPKDTTSWHVVRASLSAIRRYLEISLLLWIDTIDPSLASIFDESPRMVASAGCRPLTYTADQMSRLHSLVIARVRPATVWHSIRHLHECGAVGLLYRIIARNAYAHNNWPCRNECTRLAVEILNLMATTYDLADEIVSTDVYSFPTGLNSVTYVGSSPSISLSSIGNSPHPAATAGSAEVTVHLPSPNAAVGRQEPRGLINQLLDIVEQVGNAGASGVGARWDSGRVALRRAGRRIRDANSGSRQSDGEGEVDQGDHADVSVPDERVNGLHMLLGISREDDGWDVSVHKAVLAFICTLVYRPIVEHEHPDNPISVKTAMSNLCPAGTGVAMSPPTSQPRSASNQPQLFKTPTRFVPGSSNRPNRKRKLDDTPVVQALSIATSSCQNSFTPASSILQCDSPNQHIGSSNFSEYSSPSTLGRHWTTRLLYRQARLWNIVRRQHGIMTLLFHLETKQPISEADSIRTLACRGLVGLARSEDVRSMLAKMPLFTKALIQLLMKEPILPDRLSEHAEFCRYATMLIRLVVGNLSDGLVSGDLSLERVRRAEIVAKTRIQWDQDELLELIYRHLHSKGFRQAATALQQEANLKVSSIAPSQLPLYDDFNHPPGETPPHKTFDNTTTSELNATLNTSQSGDQCDPDIRAPASAIEDGIIISRDSSNSASDIALQPSLTPNLRLTKLRPTTPLVQTPKPCRDRFERPALSNLKPVTNQPSTEMTLSKVVESFLLQQHAQCPHPVSICPKFSLYHPHRCPAPRVKKQSNFCQRFLRNEALYGSLRLRPSRREDRHFVHRRFQPTAIIRETEGELLTTCCFSLADDGLFLGATSGSIAWVNIEEDGLPAELFHVQMSSIRHLAHARDGQRLLVCSEWGEPATVVAQLRPAADSTLNSCPWELVSEDFLFRLSDARYAEFSNTGNQDRIVATYGKIAKVFDLTTGSLQSVLFSSVKQSGYMLNKATFSPSDQLVLNDGVVWDRRCSGSLSNLGSYGSNCQPIHKIDKFQDTVSGVFHPNGLEIIVGSAVWDIRTWRLLHTIQALDRLEVKFNAMKDVIYAGTFGLDEEDYPELGNNRLVSQNMFRTVDALDYSLIASINVRHRIEQLALDTTGQSIALVEKVGENSSSDSITQCRIYTVGRKRGEREADNDEEGREDEDEDDEDNDDDDDDDDDDDMMNDDADEIIEMLEDSIDSTSNSDENNSSSESSGVRPRRHPRRRSRRLRSQLNHGANGSREGDSSQSDQQDGAESGERAIEEEHSSDSSWETMDEDESSENTSDGEDNDEN